MTSPFLYIVVPQRLNCYVLTRQHNYGFNSLSCHSRTSQSTFLVYDTPTGTTFTVERFWFVGAPLRVLPLQVRHLWFVRHANTKYMLCHWFWFLVRATGTTSQPGSRYTLRLRRPTFPIRT